MRRASLLVAAAVVGLATLPASAASSYAEPTFGVPWDTTTLDILIHPPQHGQIANGYGVLAGWRIKELDPLNNSYLDAIEASINDWRRAIKAYAPLSLSSRLRINSYVIGRDTIPQGVLRDPEGVITTLPHQGDMLGITAHGNWLGTKCVISNARFFIESFTYTDMRNISSHEFGHCLGIDHVVNQRPTHDVMGAVYTHEPGTVGTHRHCPSNLNVRAVTRAFGAIFGRTATGTVTIPIRDYRTFRC